MNDAYRWEIEVVGPGGQTLGIRRFDPDWVPVEEQTWLEALLAERLPSSTTFPLATVTPSWHAEKGEPYVEAFEVCLEGSARVRHGFGYFSDAASRLSGEFVERGELAVGDTFVFHVRALPADATDAADARTPGLRATALVRREVPVLEVPRAERLDGTTVLGEPVTGDLPVVLSREILDEGSAISRGAGPREVGGVLLGRLHRDPVDRGVFVEVTAQIPALEAKGTLTHLEFTPETWAGVDELIRMRGTDELQLGFWHYHPAHLWQCRNCPVERRRRCSVALGFFSEEDCVLHRTVFPQAYTIAIVVSSISDAEHRVTAYGWRDGRIKSRAIHVREPVLQRSLVGSHAAGTRGVHGDS